MSRLRHACLPRHYADLSDPVVLLLVAGTGPQLEADPGADQRQRSSITRHRCALDAFSRRSFSCSSRRPCLCAFPLCSLPLRAVNTINSAPPVQQSTAGDCRGSAGNIVVCNKHPCTGRGAPCSTSCNTTHSCAPRSSGYICGCEGGCNWEETQLLPRHRGCGLEILCKKSTAVIAPHCNSSTRQNTRVSTCSCTYVLSPWEPQAPSFRAEGREKSPCNRNTPPPTLRLLPVRLGSTKRRAQRPRGETRVLLQTAAIAPPRHKRQRRHRLAPSRLCFLAAGPAPQHQHLPPTLPLQAAR